MVIANYGGNNRFARAPETYLRPRPTGFNIVHNLSRSPAARLSWACCFSRVRSRANMAIQIVCPNCRTTYNVAEEQTGKKVRCKKCEAVFTAELPQAKPDAPPEERAALRRPKEKPDAPADEEMIERRRPQPRSAVPARRRDRYEDDDEDFRPRRPRARKRKSSHVGLFLIVGGVIASLFMVVGCVALALWLFTREPTKNGAAAEAAIEARVQALFVPPPGDDNGPDGDNNDNKPDAPKDANVK